MKRARSGSPEERGDGRHACQPESGNNDERRFLGCLNDLTLDRVRVEAERLRPEAEEGSAARGSIA